MTIPSLSNRTAVEDAFLSVSSFPTIKGSMFNLHHYLSLLSAILDQRVKIEGTTTLGSLKYIFKYIQRDNEYTEDR
jgi:hypothetical protein